MIPAALAGNDALGAEHHAVFALVFQSLKALLKLFLRELMGGLLAPAGKHLVRVVVMVSVVVAGAFRIVALFSVVMMVMVFVLLIIVIVVVMMVVMVMMLVLISVLIVIIVVMVMMMVFVLLIIVVVMMVMMVVVMMMVLIVIVIVIVVIMVMMAGAVGIVALALTVVMMVMVFMLLIIVVVMVMVMVVVLVFVLIVIIVIIVVMVVVMLMLLIIVVVMMVMMVVVMMLVLISVLIVIVIVIVMVMMAGAVGIVALAVVMMMVVMFLLFPEGAEHVLQSFRFFHCGTDLVARQLVPLGGDDLGIGVMRADKRDGLRQLFIGETRRMAEHDTARALYLVIEELAEVLHVHFALFRIDYRRAGIEAQLRFSRALNGTDNVGELAHSRGLDDDTVGSIFRNDFFKSLAEIAHQRTADTAGVHLRYLYARLLQKAAVDADITELVFDDDQLFTGISLFYQLFDKCCFSGTQKSGKNIDFCH